MGFRYGQAVLYSSLIADVAPSVTVEPERQTVGTGQTTTIRCVVTGSPQPVITWSRQGGQLDDNFQVQLPLPVFPGVKEPKTLTNFAQLRKN